MYFFKIKSSLTSRRKSTNNRGIFLLQPRSLLTEGDNVEPRKDSMGKTGVKQAAKENKTSEG